MDTATAAVSLRFGRFELQPHERRLLVDGKPAALGSRALDLLLVLAERAGQLVGRHALMDLVWPDVVVEDNNLAAQISALRKVLGGDVIATIPGRGYRFTARLDSSRTVSLPAALPASPASPASALLPLPLLPSPPPPPPICPLSCLRYWVEPTTSPCSAGWSISTVWSASSAPAAWASRCSPSTC
jgi:DNA-binding winged helix-turn-helix (wHTH) protein